MMNYVIQQINRDYPKVVIVASAGNSSDVLNGINHFPGGLTSDNLITVASVDKNSQTSSFSNINGNNNEVTIAAHGTNVLVGGVQNNTVNLYASGTSFAAPYVTGTVALLQAIDPRLSATEIKTLIVSTASTSGWLEDGSKQTISDQVGGKIIRTDEAIFKLINQLQTESGKKVFTRDYLFDVTDVILKASADVGSYVIMASVPETVYHTTELEMIAENNDLSKGRAINEVNPQESITWQVAENPLENDDPKGDKVIVKRLDTGAYAYVYLTEDTHQEIIKTESTGYPEMLKFTKKLRLGKVEMITLNGHDDPQVTVEKLFEWYDTIGNEADYDNEERYGWFSSDGRKTSYKSPDLRIQTKYYDGDVIVASIRGSYTEDDEKRNFGIEFYEDGSLSRVFTNEYGLEEGDIKVEFMDNEILRQYEEIVDGIYTMEQYNYETGTIEYQTLKEKFDDRWLLQGISTSYHENGVVSDITAYKEDKKHGTHEIFTESGMRIRLENYFEGQLSGEYIEYGEYDDGYHILEESSYLNGLRDGKAIFYLPNQQISKVYHYKEGLLDGPFESYVDGVIKYSGQCEAGSAVGTWTEYNEDGSVHGSGHVSLEKMSTSSFAANQTPGYYILKEADWVY